MKIPKFKTTKQAAEFWDTHSFKNYFQDTKDAEIEFISKPKKTLTIRLDSKDIDQVEKLAKYKGLNHSSLIRMWIKEMMRKEIKEYKKAS